MAKIPQPKSLLRTISKSAQKILFVALSFAVIISGSSSTASAANQSIKFNSIKNFRDASSSASVLKPGVLYRSASLSGLSAKESEKLAKLLTRQGVIIDMREVKQRKSQTDRNVAGVKNVKIPIESVLNLEPMVTDPARRQQIRKVLKLALNTKGPVLIHCVAGKDRTGWLTAMIMYASGATDAQVMKEYMKSSAAYPGGVEKAWMNSGLKAARSKYGSIPNYLQKGVGLSKTDLQKIRNKFAVDPNRATSSSSPSVNDYSQKQCTSRHLIWNKSRDVCLNKCANGYSAATTGSDNKIKSCKKTSKSEGRSKKGADSNRKKTVKSSQFRVASFNIRTAMGASGAGRMRISVNFANKHNFDIIGVQELGHLAQYNTARSKKFFGKEFDIYPNTYTDRAHGNLPSQSILYKRSKFKKISTGKIAYKGYYNKDATKPSLRYAAVVLLQDRNSGVKFYVVNTHNSAFAHRSGNRYDSGLRYREAIEKLRAKGYPVIFTGDFNEGGTVRSEGPNLTYRKQAAKLNHCVLIEGKLMVFAADAAKGLKSTCPAREFGGIDRIYVTPDVKVQSYTQIPGGYKISGSDHRLVPVAQVIVSGADSRSPTIQDPISKSECADKNRVWDNGKCLKECQKGYKANSKSERFSCVDKDEKPDDKSDGKSTDKPAPKPGTSDGGASQPSQPGPSSQPAAPSPSGQPSGTPTPSTPGSSSGSGTANNSTPSSSSNTTQQTSESAANNEVSQSTNEATVDDAKEKGVLPNTGPGLVAGVIVVLSGVAAWAYRLYRKRKLYDYDSLQ